MLTLDKVFNAQTVLKNIIRETDLVRHCAGVRAVLKTGKLTDYGLVQGEGRGI